MPYRTGEPAIENDHVKHDKYQRTGVVTSVQPNYPSMPGHEAISVKYDDGGHVGQAAAVEYSLIRRD